VARVHLPHIHFSTNKCNKTMPYMHCMYNEQLLVAVNIDARSLQLLYNTGRTALIVHNVQGVVLSFDFSCVSVFVDVLCFHHIQSYNKTMPCMHCM
jgi:hypothetical protein